MKSLRALLHALYSLLAALLRPSTPRSRPSFGPALPTPYAAPTRATGPGPFAGTGPRSPGPNAGARALSAGIRARLRERAARPPLPPHVAAILASAPDVEPEFVRRPRATPANPFHRIAAKVRVFNPRPALAAPVRAVTVGLSAWGERLRRAVSEIHAWLAFDTAPPRREALRS